jgi:hypothetical protein
MGQQFRDAEAIYFAARREGKKYTGQQKQITPPPLRFL